MSLLEKIKLPIFDSLTTKDNSGSNHLDLNQGLSLVVAVSGGIDSVVLLDLLTKFDKLKLAVAHVNHNFRKTSSQDALFVAELAQRKNLPFYLFEAKNPPLANFEDWGRKVRYSFFTDLKNALNLDGIVTGHTASDNAELFLMQLFANKVISPMTAYEERRKVIRPLINITRGEIFEYAKFYKLTWIEDESNQNNLFLRNKVRNILMPTLNNIFDGNVEKTVLNQLAKIDSLNNFIQQSMLLNLQELKRYTFGSKDWLSLVKKQIIEINQPALSVYVDGLLYPQLKSRLGRGWPERIKQFLLSNAPKIQLPGQITIYRYNSGIKLTPTAQKITLN